MNRLWSTFSALTSIDSVSFEEREFCDELKRRLQDLGIETYEDNVGDKLGGNCGNLFGFLPGELPQPPLLLSAHMDTVEPGRGKQPTLQDEDRIISAGDTVLGADDVAGIAIILEALTRLKESNTAFRPVELVFPVAEERYCLGSAHGEMSRITAKEGYILDLAGTIGEAANAAPTLLSFTITVRGKAAHAGFAPTDGIHAIQAAAKAIAKTPLGEPELGVTVNLGVIEGGKATNIVPEECRVVGEIRSLSHEKVMNQWQSMQDTFVSEVEAMGATVSFRENIEVTAFETPLDAPVVTRFQKVCEALDIPANIAPTLGASDQNNFALHGVQGLVVACSMHEVHSTRESTRLSEMEQCVKLLMRLLTED